MASSLALLALCATTAVAVAAAAGPVASGNMNGKYFVASGEAQDVPFNDDFASKGYEYFDMYAPEIATQYAQVFWIDQGHQALPPAIVKRFKGKVMALMGYEQDQVMVTPVGQPGVNPTEDISVPINWAYNHHYMAWMVGEHGERVEIPADPEDTSAHGYKTKFVLRDLPSAQFRANPEAPTGQMFSEGNGGESRKSFHGYPSGFAQLIDSPTYWHFNPMQIDTRNRECGVGPESIHNCSTFTPGPEPRQARYGRGAPAGTAYSGILECPCTSHYGGDTAIYNGSKTKIPVLHYSAISAGFCEAHDSLVTPDECYASVAALGVNATSFVNRTVSDATLPAGCTVEVSPAGVGTVTFNKAKSTVQCAATKRHAGQASSEDGVTLSVELEQTGPEGFERFKGEYCQYNRENVMETFMMTNLSVPAAEVALGACEAFCAANNLCWGCSIDQVDPQTGLSRWSALPECGQIRHFVGRITGDISRKSINGTATITVTGPASGWFGVGFDAKFMSDQPYTLVFNSTGVMERKIGTCGSEANHCPGNLLAPSVKVVATSVLNGMRTVVVTRPLQGLTDDHYSFSLNGLTTMDFISAIGSSQEFAQHIDQHTNKITFLTLGAPTCLCNLGTLAKMCDENGADCISFVKSCHPAPDGELLTQNNPTCNSSQYSGGLRCCGHERIMLDVDQVVPTELLRYHMKFRFWFQEYKPATPTTNASHLNLERIYKQTEDFAGEYDIPPAFRRPTEVIPGYDQWPLNTPTPGTTCTGTCPDGPDCDCTHTLKFTWTTAAAMRLIYISGHCHAPACKSMELYHNITGTPELLCHVQPKIGKGNIHEDKYDEAGYIAIPPCLFDDENLHNSTWLPAGTQLISIKKNNNTHVGHFGEMASWQMRAVTV